MNYVIENNLIDKDIKPFLNYIPKTQKLTLLLKTKDTNIQNIKLKSGEEYHYMAKRNGAFMIKLTPEMAKEGINQLIFVLECRIPNHKTITEIECNPYTITLTKENISNPIESNLERLQHEISHMIYNILKES